MMPRLLAFATLTLMAVSACSPHHDADAVRAEIQRTIDLGVAATRDQDIDTYMSLIPEDLEVLDEAGAAITHETQRANVLRDWSIIPKTLSIDVAIDSMHALRDSAVVFTSQRWERLMLRRDRATIDTVLTTQKHREVWRLTDDGWRAFGIEELGGHVLINGAPWEPTGGG